MNTDDGSDISDLSDIDIIIIIITTTISIVIIIIMIIIIIIIISMIMITIIISSNSSSSSSSSRSSNIDTNAGLQPAAELLQDDLPRLLLELRLVQDVEDRLRRLLLLPMKSEPSTPTRAPDGQFRKVQD